MTITDPETFWADKTDPWDPNCPDFWLRELGEQLDALKFTGRGRQTDRKLIKQARFLAVLVRNSGVTLSCGLARTSIHAYNNWRDEDPIFAACLEMAHEAAGDKVVQVALMMGATGEQVAVRDKQGNIIDYDTKRDPRILIELLRALDKHKRFSKGAADARSGKDDWRKGMESKMNDPEVLALIEKLADLAYAENDRAKTGTNDFMIVRNQDLLHSDVPVGWNHWPGLSEAAMRQQD